ncbi:cadherin-like domain-containing protein [Rhizobium sp. LjRoot258]|uniref:cadherin-like domain-containing protein n=1 Tax=Rhizobium sp. LjRoot258 TaxID=3342299 RepID=UPI003ECF341E
MSIEDPRISAISSENVSHDFRQDIHEDASIEASAQPGVEVAQADNSQQPEKTDRVPAAPQIAAANADPAEIVPDQNNIAHLPADVSIDDIRVEGNNLVLVQADGTEIVIVNGALHVPTFLLGEVELPQQAVIAALEQSNINVAAGPDGSYSASASAPSSGADFQDTIQQDPNDPTQLAQLLADTQQPDPGLGDGQELFDDLPTISDTTTLSLTEIEGQEGGFETQSVNGTFGFNGGADVGQITAVQFVDSLNMDEGTQNGSHLDLTSDGKPVVITVDGLTITGSVDGQPVFVLTVTNAATGAFTFTQFGPLDHPDKGQAGLDDILRLQFSYTVTDKDGDQATGVASININDDGPSTGNGVDSSAIDESDLLSGEGGNAKVEDVSLGIHWGADAGAHRDLTFSNVQDQLSGLKSDGQTVQFEISADGHTLTGFTGEGEGRTEVFVVTLDPTAPNGAYSFTLLQPLDHPQNSETGNTQLDLSFNFVASDADGDTANGSFAVDVNDDVPTINGPVEAVNLLANGDFAAGTWEQHSDWGGPLGGAANSDIGWNVDGTATVQLERVGSGYLGMTTSNGTPMVDMGSSPGNTTISQDISGLAAGQAYNLSFQAGSPDPASSGLEVYWNGKLVYTYSPTATMKSIDLDLTAIDGINTLAFKEVGNSSDNTGTYLANVSLTANTTASVLTGAVGEDDVMSFTLAPGSQFSFGADGAGKVVLGAATVASAAGIPLALHAEDYSYQNGAIVIKAGVFNSLNAGEIATINVPFTVTDADGDSKGGVYQIQITGVNDVASISGVAAGVVVEDGTLQANGSLSVTDVDHGENHFQTPPSLAGQYGTFGFNPATGVWNYTLNNALAQSLGQGAHFNETLTVTSADGTATQTITVTVNGTNDAPQLSAITGWTFKDTAADDTFSPVVGQLQSSDVDLDDSATYGISGTGVVTGTFTGGYNIEKVGAYGTLYLNSATGAYTYVPNDGAIEALKKGATETFTLTVTDGAGASDSKPLTITLDGTNDTPVAVADTNMVKEAGVGTFGDWKAEGNVLSNDTDRDAGDTKVVSDLENADIHLFGVFVKAGDYGVLQLNRNGSYTYSLNNFDKDTNRLAQGETAYETFTYTARDASGAASTTTLTIEIKGTNDAPSASFQYNTVKEGISTADSSVATGNLLYGASDVDNGAVVQVASVDGKSDGSTGIAGDYGKLTWDASTGTYSYALDNTKASVQALAAGEVRYETFDFTVKDEWGATDTNKLTIKITGTNDAPVIADSHAMGGVIEMGADATGAARGTNTVSDTLVKSDVDTDDSASNDKWSVVAGDGQTASGQAAVTTAYGTFKVDQDGKWTYTLNDSTAATQGLALGETRTETFTVKVTDSHNASDTQSVTVTITGSNDAPVITTPNAGATLTETANTTGSNVVQQASGSLAFTDVDLNDVDHKATVTGVATSDTTSGLPANLMSFFKIDSVTKAPGSTAGEIKWSFSAPDKTFDYLGAADHVTLKYTVLLDDGDGGKVSQIVTIVVNGTNDAPVITGGSTSEWVVEEGYGWLGFPRGESVASGTLAKTDVDLDDNSSNDSWSITPRVGQVVDGTLVKGVYGSIVVDANGKWTYTLDNTLASTQGLALNATASEKFDVTVTDSHGATATQAITVNVLGSNDGPVIADTHTTGSVIEAGFGTNGIATISDTLVKTDVDSDDNPGNDFWSVGNAWSNADNGKYGTLSIDQAGKWTYVLDNGRWETQGLGLGQTATETFTVMVRDSHGEIDTQNVVITVTGTNDAPVITGGDTSATVKEAGAGTGGDAVESGILDKTDVDGDDDGSNDSWSVVASGNQIQVGSSVKGVYGMLSVDQNGKWTYNLDNGLPATQALKNGDQKLETFTVEVTDSHGVSDTQTVSITVRGTNDAPVANDDTFTVSEDGVSSHTSSANPLVVGNVLANDMDVDSASLSVTGISNVTVTTANGTGLTLSVSSEGNGVYKIATNFGDAHLSVGSTGDVKLWSDSGEDPFKALGVNETATIKFDYTVSDGSSIDQASATITVQGSNDNPVAVDDPATYSDNFNNTSIDGWRFVSLSGSPSWSMNGNGLGEQTNSSSNDGKGIALAPSDSLPPASKIYTIEVDGDPKTSGNGNPKSNQALGVVFGYQDSTHYYRAYWKDFGTDYSNQSSHRDLVLERIDGNQVTVLGLVNKINLGSETIHFKVEVDGNGIDVTVTGNGETAVLHSSDTPAIGSYGVYTSDNDDGIAYDNFTASTGAPIATAEDTSLVISTVDLLANDSDVDGDTLSIIGVSGTSAHGGTVTLSNNGTITYNPAANYNGKDTFTYTVSDSHGGTATATVTVNVTPVNDTPVAPAVTLAAIAEDSGAHLITAADLLAGATDADGDALTVTNLTASSGTLVANGNGTWTYTPVSNDDASASFSYKVSDGTATVSGSATLDLTPVNDAPTAVSEVLTSVVEDSGARTISFASLTTNDSTGPANEAGQSLTVTAVSNAVGGAVAIVNGQVVFTPAADFNGTASFDYTIRDNGQTNGSDDFKTSVGHASFAVTPVNDAPTAVSEVLTSVVEDSGARTISFASLTTNDSTGPANEAGQSLTVTAVSNAVGGAVAIVNGQVVFTPAADFNGTASFDYTIRDNGQTNGSDDFQTSVGHASFAVTPVNDAPVAPAVTLAAIAEDSGAHLVTTADLLAGATDVDHDTLSVSGVSASSGTLVDNHNGTWTFTPAGDDDTSVSFSYTVSDGTTTVPGSATLDLTPVNDAPVAPAVTLAAIAEDSGAHLITTADLLAGATDVDHDTLSVSDLSASSGTLVDNHNGTWTFTPAGDDDTSVSFSYTVSDGTTTVPGSATLDLTPVNDAPVAPAVTLAAIAEDSGAHLVTTADLLAGATDVDHDTLSVSGVSASSGTLVDNHNGTWTFTPAGDDDTSVSFSYTVSDGTTTVPGSATLDLTPVNDAPVAPAVTLAAIAEDSGAHLITTADLLAGATDVDHDTLSVSDLSASSGTLVDNHNGTWTFTPAGDDDTSVSFSYTVSDGTTTVPGSATLDLTPVNDAPVAPAVTLAAIAEDSGAHLITTADLLAGATDVDHDTLSVSGLSASSGTLVDNHNGTWTFTPAGDDDTSVSFSYTVSDGTTTVPGSATLDLTPVNDAPVAPVDSNAAVNSVAENAANGTPVGITAQSTDVDGDAVTYSLVDDAGGRFAINSQTGVVTVANGTLLDFETATSHTITVKAADASGAFSTQNFTIGVSDVNEGPVNHAPEAGGTAKIYTNSDSAPIADWALLHFASDADGDTLSITGASATSAQDTASHSTSQVTFSDGNSNGGSFNYTVSDGSASATGTAGVIRDTTGNLDGTTAAEILITTNGTNTIDGHGGGDIILGGNAKDTIYAYSDLFYVDGGNGTDTLTVNAPGDGVSVDLSSTTIVNVENLTSVDGGSNDSYNQTLTVSATQWANFSSIDMNDGSDVLNVKVTGSMDISGMGTPGLDDIETGNLVGTTGDDAITLTGAQLNAMGNGSINLGGGADTINLMSTSTVLNGLGNSGLQGVELISAASANSGVTINLSNQSEAFTITGSSSNDTLTGGSGADAINGGAGSDTITGGGGGDTLTGGGAANVIDTFVIGSGDSTPTIGGSGNNGTISGYDVITDFNTLVDKLNLPGTAVVVANAQIDGGDSSLTIGSDTVESHSVTNGMVTFFGTDAFGTPLTVNSLAALAAVVQYLQNTDIGSTGATIGFNATIDGVAHTYVYMQGGSTNTNGTNTLVDLANNTVANLNTLIGNRIDPIILDLDHNGVALTSLDQGVQFDINADGHKDQIAWTAGTDGILALDVDGNGKIDNGSEIFSPHFAGGSYVDGLAALSTLDSNHDGKIDAADEAFSKLTVWQDLNHNGITDSGELSSLADHSISSISLDATVSNSEINGQSILADGSYTLTDGSAGHFVEVAFDTTLGDSENGGNAYSLIGSDGDDTLSGSGGMFTISGGAGADTFVLDADALNDVKLADVITDFKASEGDTLDVSKLLDSLLGHEASEAEALASVKTTVSGTDTAVSVNANGGWHDVAVLQNTTEAVKILFDDKHDTTTAPHVG